MATGRSGVGSPAPTATAQAAAAPATSTAVCGNVKGATTMANGMVMAPVSSGNPTVH